MSILKILGHNVKKYREQNGWSQEALADVSGLHRTYISGIERGVRNPTIIIVSELATALKVRPCDLLEKGDK